jgi:hypothetical protein
MVLSNASPRLKELFNSTQPVKLSRKDRNEGNTIRWTLMMCPEPMAEELDPEGLTFKWFKPLPVSASSHRVLRVTITDHISFRPTARIL